MQNTRINFTKWREENPNFTPFQGQIPVNSVQKSQNPSIPLIEAPNPLNSVYSDKKEKKPTGYSLLNTE